MESLPLNCPHVQEHRLRTKLTMCNVNTQPMVTTASRFLWEKRHHVIMGIQGAYPPNAVKKRPILKDKQVSDSLSKAWLTLASMLREVNFPCRFPWT